MLVGDRQSIEAVGVGYDASPESDAALAMARALAAGRDAKIHYGPARRLMLDTTAKHLTLSARCPPLVLPRGAAEPAPGRASAAEQARAVS